MIRYAILLLVCLMFTGCGGGSASAPVSGVITLDGEPLENASVIFSPPAVDGEVIASYGMTDAAGKYSLKVISTDAGGAVLGNHTVAIALNIDSTGDSVDDSDEEVLPEHDFTFEVKSGGSTSANFDL